MRLAIAAAIILIVPAARAECPPEMTPQECSERIQNGISFVSNGYGDTTNSQERSGSWGSRLWRDRIPTGGSGDDESLPAWRRRVRDATAATPLNESERLSAARIEHAVVQKDYPAAREEVENYRRYNPGAPISYQWGAEVAAEQGDRAGALREVEQGLKAAPGDPGLTQLQKFLRPKVDESSTAGLQGKMDSFMKAARAGSDLSAELDSARSVQRFAPAASERGGERGSAEASPLAHAVMAGAGPALGAALPRASPRISPSRGSVAGLDAARDERQASRAIAENPKDAQAWAARALSRRAEGDLQGALQDAARAASLAPEDPRAGKLLAMVLIDLRRYPEARARLNRALSEEPRDAEALSLRAITFEREGKPARMLMDLRRAARIDPERFAKLYQEALAQYGVQASGGRQAEEPAAGAAGSPRTPPWAFPAVAAILIALAALREVSGSSARGAAPAAVLSRAAATPPAAVEEIELVRPIGEGGMGVVYEGFDAVLRRRVALKKMRPEIAADPRESELFLREARTVAALSHPNIVQIYRVLSRPDGLYLVFEYLEGQTLDSMLAQEGKLPPARALPLLEQIAAGLDYAHSRGVVHRDLKPANVLVSGDGIAKVADFGIARVERETMARLTRGAACGTPAYMAPEQALGREGPAADIYAFGACAYELLAGRRPYADGATDLKRLRAYPPLSAFGAAFAAADPVIARALDPEPSQRPASAGELAAGLRAALAA